MTEEWEGGRRQGMRWRGLLVGALVVAVLAGGVWLNRRDAGLPVETGDEPIAGATQTPDVVVTSPRRAGTRWFCPNGFPIRARGDVYYPLNFPRDGVVERPEQCFADRARAEAAGYRLASPPDGAVVAGGVYLLPVEHPEPSACRELAGDVGFTVPCPRRLPAPAYGPTCTQARCLFRDGVVIEQRAFLPPGHWCQSCPARVVVTAARTSGPRELVACGPGEALPRLPSQPVTAEACPHGPPWIPGIGGYAHEGNPVYRWQRGRVVYATSVEATAPLEDVRALLRAIVDAIEHVPPP